MPDPEFLIDKDFLKLVERDTDSETRKAWEDYEAAAHRYTTYFQFRNAAPTNGGPSYADKIDAAGQIERAQSNVEFWKGRVEEQGEYARGHARKLADSLLAADDKRAAADRDVRELDDREGEEKTAERELDDALAASARSNREARAKTEQQWFAQADRDAAVEKDLADAYARVRPIFLRYAREHLKAYELLNDRDEISWYNLRDATTLLAIRVERSIALLVTLQNPPPGPVELNLAKQVLENAAWVQGAVNSVIGANDIASSGLVRRLLPGLENWSAVQQLARLSHHLERYHEFIEFLEPVESVLEGITYRADPEQYRTPEERVNRECYVFALSTTKAYLQVALVLCKTSGVGAMIVSGAEVTEQVVEYFWERRNRQIIETAQRDVDVHRATLIKFLQQDSAKLEKMRTLLWQARWRLQQRAKAWGPAARIFEDFIRKHGNVKPKAAVQQPSKSPAEIEQILTVRDHKGFMHDDE